MPTSAGFLTSAALRREALVTAPTWPAAAPAAANVRLPLLSADIDERPVWQSHARQTPEGGRQAGSPTGLICSGPMTLYGVYNRLAPIWAMALGRMAKRLGGTDNPETLASGAYRHTMEIDPQLHAHAWELGGGVELGDGILIGQQLARRATLVLDYGVSAWEFLSAMVGSLALQIGPRRATMNLNWLAHSLDQSSATNPNLSSVDQPDWVELCLQDLDVRLAPYSASTALDAGDAIEVSSFGLFVANHLAGRQTESSGLYIAEPKRTAMPSVTGTLTQPFYESDTLTAWASASTELMLSAVFTGPEIASTGVNYSLEIYCPSITLRERRVRIEGQSMPVPGYTFEATSPSAAAAGMPAAQSAETPLMVRVTDEDSNHALYAA